MRLTPMGGRTSSWPALMPTLTRPTLPALLLPGYAAVGLTWQSKKGP
jgi:hypothetical protein